MSATDRRVEHAHKPSEALEEYLDMESATTELWLQVLGQSEHWVPRRAWNRFADASITGQVLTPVYGPSGREVPVGPSSRWLTVTADFSVEGVIRLADMDREWRDNVIGFVWKNSPHLCRKQAGAVLRAANPLGADMFRHHLSELTSQAYVWAQRSSDDTRRRDWFDQLPFIVAARSAAG